MAYEIYGRICVGAVLTREAATAANEDFLASLGLPATASADDVYTALRDATAKHKLHEPDRVRYERAFEAFLDERWSVDFALGGLSRDGLVELERGYVFVGVRVEQFEITVSTLATGASAPDRPQWLRKGDLGAGSELAKALGPDAKKAMEHAGRSYQRAGKEILKDAIARVKSLPISKQHEPDWALCRWAVDSQHASVQHRHGGRAR